jgi:hypothetical protein
VGVHVAQIGWVLQGHATFPAEIQWTILGQSLRAVKLSQAGGLEKL